MDIGITSDRSLCGGSITDGNSNMHSHKELSLHSAKASRHEDIGIVGFTKSLLAIGRYVNRGAIVVRELTKGTSYIRNYGSHTSDGNDLITVYNNNKNDKDYINYNLLELVGKCIINSYLEIKGTINDDRSIKVSETTLKSLSSEVVSGRYRPLPVKRLYIPKGNNKGSRPIGIACTKDKIVQKAMLMVLRAIYEVNFHDNSHGFMSNHSCHTAVKDIRYRYHNCNWFIEIDISKCFDSIDHEILYSLLCRKIKDKGFLDLYRKVVKAGYVERDHHYKSILGVPQGSIIGPILTNIYLTEFDYYMDSYKNNFDRGQYRKQSKEYYRSMYKTGNAREAIRKGIRARDMMDSSFRRLQYIRYADDMLLGVIGSKADCVKIRDDIGIYLRDNLKLSLNIEKTIISNTGKGSMFLGFHIRIPKDMKLVTVTRFDRKVTTRNSTRPIITIPLERVLERLHSKGYLVKDHLGIYKASRNTSLYQFDLNSIILNYNLLYIGLENYYCIAMNKGLLNKINWLLMDSLALTLANKYKLRSRSAVYKTYPYIFKPNITKAGVSTYIKYDFQRVLKKSAKPIKIIGLETIFSRFVTPRTSKDNILNTSICSICGSNQDLHVHHVRHIKDIKHNPIYSRVASIVNRKQIMLCSLCHVIVHNGLYRGPKKL